ncbi:hypothetical protein EYF80_015817 [Liparis tanakae]|uniref:Uncharacterized protein n=1 Tax=Liparis tanakae TaxID=230148 RepID=A0A4Z2I7G6_9TELE|nr:hypothetical protein EYF80_015817 [Liparis tanakae]
MSLFYFPAASDGVGVLKPISDHVSEGPRLPLENFPFYRSGTDPVLPYLPNLPMGPAIWAWPFIVLEWVFTPSSEYNLPPSTGRVDGQGLLEALLDVGAPDPLGVPVHGLIPA